MSTMLKTFRTFAPITQWLTVGLLAVMVLLLWQWYVWAAATTLNERADEYKEAITRAGESDHQLNDRIEAAILALGETEPLTDEVMGTAELSAVIARVLDDHNVLSRDVDTKPRVKFSSRDRPRMVPAGYDGERVTAEVRFEASPEDAFAVIAELESSPEVETVSKVRISRTTDRRKKTVNVQMSVEAWVVPGLRSPPRNTGSDRADTQTGDTPQEEDATDDSAASNVAGASAGEDDTPAERSTS